MLIVEWRLDYPSRATLGQLAVVWSKAMDEMGAMGMWTDNSIKQDNEWVSKRLALVGYPRLAAVDCFFLAILVTELDMERRIWLPNLT